ncbi:hypothetical protein Ancab_005354 [Ancistrocladus abbreviatus]
MIRHALSLIICLAGTIQVKPQLASKSSIKLANLDSCSKNYCHFYPFQDMGSEESLQITRRTIRSSALAVSSSSSFKAPAPPFYSEHSSSDETMATTPRAVSGVSTREPSAQQERRSKQAHDQPATSPSRQGNIEAMGVVY